MDFWRNLFGTSDFMPHGYCYLWNTGLVWLHVISDSLIALSYFAIPVTLFTFVRKRRDVPFSWMFVLFGVFIVACGMTHAMEVWNLWHADYWLAGGIKAITAAASVPTAILLGRLMPAAMSVPSSQQWMQANARLEKEVQDRRELELDLRIREASYREQAALLDLTHDSIFVRGIDSTIRYWNRGSERMYGWQREQALHKVSHQLLHTRFPVPLPEIEAEVYRTGSWEGELVHYRRDGVAVTVSSRWALQRDTGGKPAQILEVNRDITQRKIEENRFRSLVESAPDAVVIVNQKGEIQVVNAQTQELFGYSREELIGKPVETLVPERFRTPHVEHRGQYLHSPARRPMGAGLQLRGRRKDGSEFPVEISLAPIETEEGVLISSAIRDITERARSEERIQELNEELNKRIAELRAINKELETFSYSVSHDLRAPLRHIDGFARILNDELGGTLSPNARDYLDRILQAAGHMGHLVDDLLNLARIGRKQLSREKVNLGTLLREAMEDLTQGANGRTIEWKIEPLPDADCDPGLIKLVFANLISNAVKFTRNQPHTRIEVAALPQSNGTQTFFVRDNGVGFNRKYADKLFGVFQRLHSETEFEGTGVGLATVQRIIHRHGGEIWAESAPGQGATFFFTLGQPSPAEISQER